MNEIYKKITLVPYNSTILITFFPTLDSLYPMTDFNEGYSYNPESLYINTISEQELDFGEKGTIELFCYKARSFYDYKEKVEPLKTNLLAEIILFNIENVSEINLVGEMVDIIPGEDNTTIKLDNTNFVQLAIAKESNKKFYIFILDF